MTAEQMIVFMKDMENGQRIEFLEYLSLNHFDSRIDGDMILATRYYIEDYLDKNLTEEESEVMELAYKTGYSQGYKIWN